MHQQPEEAQTIARRRARVRRAEDVEADELCIPFPLWVGAPWENVRAIREMFFVLVADAHGEEEVQLWRQRLSRSGQKVGSATLKPSGEPVLAGKFRPPYFNVLAALCCQLRVAFAKAYQEESALSNAGHLQEALAHHAFLVRVHTIPMCDKL